VSEVTRIPFVALAPPPVVVVRGAFAAPSDGLP
jgi:hypothetical protein